MIQSFAKEAREQCEILQSMFRKMELLYTDLSEFFSFDKLKYTLEEFFSDVKTFKDAFYVSLWIDTSLFNMDTLY